MTNRFLNICRPLVWLLPISLCFLQCTGQRDFRHKLLPKEGSFLLISGMDTIDLATNIEASISCVPSTRIILKLKGNWSGFLGIYYGEADFGTPKFIIEESIVGECEFEFPMAELACSWERFSKSDECHPPDYLCVGFTKKSSLLYKKLISSVKLNFLMWGHECYCDK